MNALPPLGIDRVGKFASAAKEPRYGPNLPHNFQRGGGERQHGGQPPSCPVLSHFQEKWLSLPPQSRQALAADARLSSRAMPVCFPEFYATLQFLLSWAVGGEE
jgi:hypothetical protein